MQPDDKTTILFTSYAPVHFLCFRPLFNHLIKNLQVRVLVSGGLRTKRKDSGYDYDEHALYDPFDLLHECIMETTELASLHADILFAANTKLIEPKSVGKRVQLFHGISFRNRAIRAANLKCDHYFIVGPYMRRRFLEPDMLSQEDPRAVEMGFMKTDALLNGELNRDELLAHHGFDGTRPVILFAPTGDKYNSLEIMGKEVLQQLANSQKYDILVKLHDHPKNKKVDWFTELAPLESPHLKVVRDFDVIPLLFLAGLLISDASSVSSEYSLLDRPMIFLDVPKLIARMMERKATMIDLDTWGRRGGVIVNNPDQILRAVEDSLANPSRHSEVRQAMAQDLFYNPGKATEKAISWLSPIIGTGSSSKTALNTNR